MGKTNLDDLEVSALKVGGSPISAPPTKASGSDVDTGTDDAKYVTPKAIADSHIGVQPKRYVALLTQSGTDAPTAVVLENTLGGAVVWTRDGEGSYIATLSGAFPVGREWLFPKDLTVKTGSQISFNRVDDDSLVLTTEENFMIAFPVEIRVYP